MTYCCTCNSDYILLLFKLLNVTIATICASVGSSWQCFDYCTFEAVIKGMRFYNGLSELKLGTRILCVLEQNNPKHTKAILVKHSSGEKLGHLSLRNAEVILSIYELHPNIWNLG